MPRRNGALAREGIDTSVSSSNGDFWSKCRNGALAREGIDMPLAYFHLLFFLW